MNGFLLHRHTRFLAHVAAALGLCFTLAPKRAGAEASLEAGGGTQEAPPHTPEGLAGCVQPLAPDMQAPTRIGETLDYDVEVLGMGLGSVQMLTARQGTFRGSPVTEYRGLVRVDRLLAAVVPLEGVAAALVDDASFGPVQASNRYRWVTLRSAEVHTYLDRGREVAFRRVTNDSQMENRRRFHAPVQDFLTGFYFLRRLAPESHGCSLIFANGKAYTVWLAPDGEETIETPFGKRTARRIHVRYASDEAALVKEARFWMSADELRIPYKAEGLNRYHPVAVLKGYTPAK